MNDNNYTLPAISAISLAVLYPVYWFNQYWNISNNPGAHLYGDVSGLNLSDGILLLIGIITIYVYSSIKRFLEERHAYSGANIPLTLLIICTAIFTFGSLSIDLLMHLFGNQLHLPWHNGAITGSMILTFSTLIVFGVLDIVLGVVLLTRSHEFSALLKAFAIITIVQGIMEVTIVLSPITFIVFPVALVIISVLYLKQPEALEVI